MIGQIESLDFRESIQRDALIAWKNSGYRGTICLPTGFGKTRVGVIAAGEYLRHNPQGKVIVVTPRINLKNKEWPDEVKKWGYADILGKIDIQVINSIYKDALDSDLLILDEAHKYFSPEFSKIFLANHEKILALSATPPEKGEEMYSQMEEKCPLIYYRTFDEAVEKGAVNDYQIINMPVTFTRKERAQYRKWDGVFKTSYSKLKWLNDRDKIAEDVFGVAEILSKKEHKHREESKWAVDFWLSMQRRKKLCYEAENKLQAVIDILQKESFTKWIMFTKTTDFADRAVEYLLEHNYKAKAFHAKLKNREVILQDFENNLFDIIVAVDGLTEGYNLPDIEAGISIAGVSTKRTNIQQIGRTIRKVKDKGTTKFFNLYVKDSQEKVWVENKTKNLSNVKWL